MFLAVKAILLGRLDETPLAICTLRFGTGSYRRRDAFARCHRILPTWTIVALRPWRPIPRAEYASVVPELPNAGPTVCEKSELARNNAPKESR